MSEELIQRNLINEPEKIGPWLFYNIGATSLKSLKQAKIIPNKDYRRYESKKPDAVIVTKLRVIAAIEYKQPKELKTKRQIAAAIAQELGTAKAIGAVVYIVTDGQKSFWINPLTGNEVKLENGEGISLNFNKSDAECIKLISKLLSSLSATNDLIIDSVMVDPLPLAQKVWQDLWAVSGATPENCLYTFVEIFIFKYLSDLGVLRGVHSFSSLMRQYESNSDNEVIELYAASIRPKIKELFPGNPKDKTTIINGTIFVSKDDKAVSGYATVFRKILKRFDDFETLENIDLDFKSKLFESFLKESISKKNWGQFFTPLKVVRSIVSMADIVPGMKICDPACGVGKFLLEPIIHELHRFYKIENGQLKPKIVLCGFDKGFDKDEQKTIILAKANMLIYLSGLIKEHPDITQQFAQLFNDTFLLQTNSILGTLAKPIENEFDLILTNPPYVMSGSSNLKEEISKSKNLKQFFSVSAMGIEGLFMEWIIRALKPGGKAFVVVPDGIMNRGNDKRLRQFILDECIIESVISLPLNTFFTTNKKTYILTITKKSESIVNGISTKKQQTTPVFTYLCSEIGESRDVYRFDIEQNDLEDATTLYNMFKGAREYFSINNKRCKIIPINVFYESEHWSIERWWTHEEKIELGIKDKIEAITIEDYSSLLNDTASSLIEICEELGEYQTQRAKSKFYRMENFKLCDILEPVKGKSKYTKKYGSLHKGEYPVFSASANTPLTFIDSFDYEGCYLSWSTNGFAGVVSVLNGKFSINGDRGVLLPKIEQLDIQYLKYVLEPIFRNLAKGRKGDNDEDEFTKLYPSMINDIAIPLPINKNGEICLSSQKKIAKSFNAVEDYKRIVQEKLNVLITQKISL